MAETEQASDMSMGFSMLFGVLGVLAAVGMAATAVLAEANHSDQMQLLSGVALTVALVAGGLAVVAIHLLE